MSMSGPPILLRDVDAEQAHRLGLLDQPLVVRGVELRGVGVQLRLERDDLLAHEAADLVDQHLLFVVGLEIHGALLSAGLSRPRLGGGFLALSAGRVPWSALCSIRSSNQRERYCWLTSTRNWQPAPRSAALALQLQRRPNGERAPAWPI